MWVVQIYPMLLLVITVSTRNPLNGTKLFLNFFVDILVVNSFLCHKELFERRNDPTMRKPLSQNMFREQLAAEMREFAESSAPPPPPPPTCMLMYYGTDATQSRRYYKRCQDAGIPRVKTPIYCRSARSLFTSL